MVILKSCILGKSTIDMMLCLLETRRQAALGIEAWMIPGLKGPSRPSKVTWYHSRQRGCGPLRWEEHHLALSVHKEDKHRQTFVSLWLFLNSLQTVPPPNHVPLDADVDIEFLVAEPLAGASSDLNQSKDQWVNVSLRLSGINIQSGIAGSWRAEGLVRADKPHTHPTHIPPKERSFVVAWEEEEKFEIESKIEVFK